MPYQRRRSSPSHSFPRLLYVDPDASERDRFVKAFESRGFLIDVAASGAEARERMRSAHYAVMVTELDLHDTTAGQLMEDLVGSGIQTQFIALSSRARNTLPVNLPVGDRLTATVRRPWDVDELTRTLHQSVRLWRSRATPNPSRDDCLTQSVLLVEDDASYAELVREYLDEVSSCRVTHAPRLEDALAHLLESSYEVIVSDLTLPDARGLEAVLRLQTAATETPLVVMSGCESETLAVEAVRAGAQDYLVKGSFDGAGLMRSIRYARERKSGELALVKQANQDPLTGLANRTQLVARLEQSIARAGRSGEHFAVLYLDLDGFKEVNDSLGHAEGDKLLIEVARRLEHTARDSDVVARLGGDEFAVLLDGLLCPADATCAAERFLKILSSPYGATSTHSKLSASIGVAVFPMAGESAGELVRAADLAMYQSKRSGKNRVSLYADARISDRCPPIPLDENLRQALDQNQFQLFYQPQFDVHAKMRGAEALLRWQRAGRPMLPQEFLPLLEASPEVLSVGYWVIWQACRQLAEWEDQRHAPERVSVNLSSAQLYDDRLEEVIASTLHRYRLSGARLELEIAESALVGNLAGASRVLERIKSRTHVRLAIDNFGAGHSALGVLTRMPFDTVKIDRSLVAGLATREDARRNTRAILALSKALGLTTAAIGVEHAAQYTFLSDEGCDLVQGYLFARPSLPATFAPEPDVSPAFPDEAATRPFPIVPRRVGPSI